MQITPINPTGNVYSTTEDYIHAVQLSGAQTLLFVSGTMGLDSNGSAPSGLDDQLKLIWANLREILANAKMTTDNIVRLTSYLRKPEYAEANQNARLDALGGRRIPTTAIVVETLQSDWFVEIEIIAAA